MPTKRRRGRRSAALTIELESRLVEGLDFFCEDEAWNVDADFRRELWFLYRDALIARWGDVTKLYGWKEFEATPEQRARFRSGECPSPLAAVRDGIGTVSTPEDPTLQALRAAQAAKRVQHDTKEVAR